MDPSREAVGLIPRGIAFVDMELVSGTQHVFFALIPQFSMSAFSSAIEPLRIANQLTGKPLYHWALVSEDGKPVRASNGVEVSVDGALEDTPRNSIIFACSGVEPQKETRPAIANWLRWQWRNGRRVGGLCTGAYALAKAGVLGGKRFTLHWENIAAFAEIYPDLQPIERLYTIDGRIFTSAGGSASTDLIVRLIVEDHGQTLAQYVLGMCLIPYNRSEEDLQKNTPLLILGNRNPKLTEIINYFEENLEDAIDIESIGELVGVSRRQIERLFKRYTSQTPSKFLSGMRLQRGRALLAETDLSVAEVSAACGFSASSHFSKRYREKFGHSPNRFLDSLV